MMQPPRHMSAMPPRLSFHLNSSETLLHEHVALRVGDDLRGIERLADVLDGLLRIAGEFGVGRAGEHGRGGDALLLERGNHAREDRLGDEGDGCGVVEAGKNGPLAGALLAGGVEDFVDEVAAVGVLELENV